MNQEDSFGERGKLIKVILEPRKGKMHGKQTKFKRMSLLKNIFWEEDPYKSFINPVSLHYKCKMPYAKQVIGYRRNLLVLFLAFRTKLSLLACTLVFLAAFLLPQMLQNNPLRKLTGVLYG